MDSLINDTLSIIYNSIKDIDTSKVAISFNGGKDCTVVYYLIREFNLKYDIKINNLVYFVDNYEHFKMKSFIQNIFKNSNMNIIITSSSFRDGCIDIFNKYNIQYIIMGQRRTDPYCKDFLFIEKCSYNFNFEMFRINPILNWSYNDVWNYLEDKNYCELYNYGYTSIGNIYNSIPNPYLLKDNSFIHAKYLLNTDYERLSRIKDIRIQVLKGTVIHGNKFGRLIDFPTINILSDDNINIDFGVYVCHVLLNNNIYNGMLYFGHNTLDNNKLIIEINLFNFSGDCYNANVEIGILKKIREPIKIYSIDELKILLANDKNNCIEQLKKMNLEI